MTKIIDGTSLASESLDRIHDEIEREKYDITLAIVLIGQSAASEIYVNRKRKIAKIIGIKTKLIRYDNDISNLELSNKIHELNNDKMINGIIVQIPMPSHINQDEIINLISIKKDVDGFNPYNSGLLSSGKKPIFTPCTPLGILDIIKSEFKELAGLNVVIIGRSFIVGRPLASLLLNHDMSVTICHSKTKNLEKITQSADIVIAATGKSKFLNHKYFTKNSVVIDVGISRQDNGKLSGDVDFDDVYGKIKAITKVPGGVGPMTVAKLMGNTLEAFKLQNIRYI